MKRILILLIVGIFATSLIRKRGSKSEITLDYYSIKKKNSYIYHGPSNQSLKAFLVLHPNWPVKVIEIKKNWIKVEDYYKNKGWIKSASLGPKKILIIKETQGYDLSKTSKPIALIEKNITANFIKKNEKFTKIEINKKEYWVANDSIWPNEK